MLETLGVIQIGSGQDAIRNKLARQFGGKSLLEWVVRRTTDCQRLNGVIVVMADSIEDRRLAELVPGDVPVFHGSQADELSRTAAALERFPAESAVHINVAYPFLDPVLIDRLISTADAHPTSDYIGYCARSGKATILSQLGVFAEWFTAKALRKADRDAKHTADREQVTRYIFSHPEKFNLRLIPTPPELDRDDVRLTINSEEDWELAQTILEALGPEHLDWQRIAGLLDHQPAMRERMAELNRIGV